MSSTLPDYKLTSAIVRPSGQVVYFYCAEVAQMFAKGEGLKAMSIDAVEQQNQDNLRDWVRDLARRQVIEVTFTKVDGSTRVLRGTLQESAIPTDKAPKGNGRVENLDIVSLFDIEAQDWRSFRIDSLQKVEIV